MLARGGHRVAAAVLRRSARAGCTVARTLAFRDHHPYSRRDVQRIVADGEGRRRRRRADDGEGLRAAVAVPSVCDADRRGCRLQWSPIRSRSSGAGLPDRSRRLATSSLADQHRSTGAAPSRPRPSLRHRLEYLAVVSVVAVVRAVADARGAGGRHAARARVLPVRSRPPAARDQEPARRVSRCARRRSAARSRARCSRISAGCSWCC